MTDALSVSERLETESCCACGVTFAMPARLRDMFLRKRQGATFYCPNGHPQSYIGETDAEKLAKANAELAQERKKREWAQQAASKANEEISKLKKRSQNGVCTCCNRSFTNLRRHMATKHPEHTP